MSPLPPSCSPSSPRVGAFSSHPDAQEESRALMSETTEGRIGKNTRTFREANERIRARAEEYSAPLERLPFLCECPRQDCIEIVRLTRPEYASVRSNPRHFFTVPGHEAVEEQVGRVIAQERAYVVVEKDPAVLEG